MVKSDLDLIQMDEDVSEEIQNTSDKNILKYY